MGLVLFIFRIMFFLTRYLGIFPVTSEFQYNRKLGIATSFVHLLSSLVAFACHFLLFSELPSYISLSPIIFGYTVIDLWIFPHMYMILKRQDELVQFLKSLKRLLVIPLTPRNYITTFWAFVILVSLLLRFYVFYYVMYPNITNNTVVYTVSDDFTFVKSFLIVYLFCTILECIKDVLSALIKNINPSNILIQIEVHSHIIAVCSFLNDLFSLQIFFIILKIWTNTSTQASHIVIMLTENRYPVSEPLCLPLALSIVTEVALLQMIATVSSETKNEVSLMG